MNRDEQKRRAAERAVELVEPGMRLGLGTGSTARRVLEALARRRDRGDVDGIVGVPTSSDTRAYAESLGIPLATLDGEPRLDMTLDGADDVDPALDVIKGLGGALLWEKIVAAATDLFVIVVDESKLVDRLGRSPVPVEVVRFGWGTALQPIRELGAEPRLRMTDSGDPFVTEEGHFILDCAFPGGLADPLETEAALHTLPGVVETGLFLGMTDTVVVAGRDGVRVLHRRDDG